MPSHLSRSATVQRPGHRPRLAATIALFFLARAASDLVDTLGGLQWHFGLPEIWRLKFAGQGMLARMTPPLVVFFGALTIWCPLLRRDWRKWLALLAGVIAFMQTLDFTPSMLTSTGGPHSGVIPSPYYLPAIIFVAGALILTTVGWISWRLDRARLEQEIGLNTSGTCRAAEDARMHVRCFPMACPHWRHVATFGLVPLALGLGPLLPLVVMGVIRVVVPVKLQIGWLLRILSDFFLQVTPLAVMFGGALLIWAPTIWWTRRKKRAIGLTGAALAAAVLLIVLVEADFRLAGFGDLVEVVASLGGAVGLVVASRICWSAPREMADGGLPCPRCGYDMRGQRECRCSECGEQFTLGDMVREATKMRG